MPARPSSIRSTFLPTCTCRPSILPASKALPSRQNLATLSVPNSPLPEPYLEFLYPTFGYFSRALPPIPIVLSPNFNPFPRFTSAYVTVGVRGSWKRSLSIDRKCVCGRAQHSCLRCRAASTSSRVGSEEVIIRDERIQDLIKLESSNLLEEDRSIDSPKPSPPPPLIIKKEIIKKSVNDQNTLVKLQNVFDRLDKVLPSVRGFTGNGALWSLERTKSTCDEFLEAVEPYMEKKGEGLDITFQLDLIRLFSRLARVLPVKSKNLDLVEDYRQELGEYMEEFLSTFSVGQGTAHSTSLALLRINSVALSGTLPPILPPTRAPDDETFFNDLRTIFQPIDFDDASTDRKKRILLAQQSALAVLLDTWGRTKDGPVEAVKFVVGWETTSLFPAEGSEKGSHPKYAVPLRQRYVSLIGRIEPTPSIWYRNYTQSLSTDKRIGPHLITYLSNRTSVLEAFDIWNLIKSRSPILYIFYQLNTPALLQGLLDANYLLDAAIVANYLSNDLLGYFSKRDKLQDSPSAPSSTSPNTIPYYITEENRPTFVNAYRILAKVSAAQGRPEKTFEMVSMLESIVWETGLEGVARQMRASTEVEQMESVKAHFKSASFEGTSEWNRCRLWGEFIRAQVRLGDLQGAKQSLEDMIKMKVKPNRAILTTLLYGHVNRGDLVETYKLFNKLPEYNIFPNVVTYTALTTLQSRRRNPEGIQRIMQEMRSVGVEPDLTTWTTLMDSLVEVGQYPAALKIFDFLYHHENRSLHPDTPARNVVLKAGCLAGAPPLTLLSLVRDGTEKGIRPNYQTYTLLMHTLCSSGMMKEAEDLYVLMGNTERQVGLPMAMDVIKPDVFTFSTLMYGYLNRGKLRFDRGRSSEGLKIHAEDLIKARAVLYEMIKRGIAPTFVTMGIIVGAFLDEGRKDGIEKAEQAAKEFLKGVNLNAPITRSKNRPLAKRDVYSVYGPIINAHAKDLAPEKALTYFTRILDANSEPSILQHTSLMDAYRRTGQTNGVRTIWRRLYNLTMNRYGRLEEIEQKLEVDSTIITNVDSISLTETTSITSTDLESTTSESSSNLSPDSTLPLPSPPPDIPILSSLPNTTTKIDPYHRNILTLPFTILIDSLSSDESFREIIQTWQQLSKEGFAFDASNWNSLALALCRRGEFVRAFDIAENILSSSEESPSIASMEFGSPDKIEFLVRNPARLAQFRRRDQQNVNSINPGSLLDLIGSEDKEGLREKEEETWKPQVLSKVFGEISKKRQNQYWFIHTSLVLYLDKILRLLNSGGNTRIIGEEVEGYQKRLKEETELRENLIRNHPKTIRRLRDRLNELDKMDDIRRDRS